MATVTNLAFNIMSRYNGQGVRRARRDLRSFQNETAIMSSNAERITRLLLMVGPAAAPAFAVAAKGASQAATSFTLAATGVGLFALAVKAQTKDVFHAVKRINTLRDALKELKPGSDAYEKNLAKQARLMASLDPMERRMVKNILRLQKAWEKFGKSVRPRIFSIINIFIKTLIVLMKRLEPVLRPVTKSIKGMALELKKFVSGKDFKRFTKWLKEEAHASMNSWWIAIKNVGMGLVALGNRLGFFDSSNFNEWLIKSTTSFRKWAESSESVDKLRAFIEEASPVVKDFLKALIHVSGSLLVALAPAGIAMLKILTPILELIADIADEFPGLIQAMWAMYAASRAVNLVMFIMRAAFVGIMAGIASLLKIIGIFTKVGKAALWLGRILNMLLVHAAFAAGAAMLKFGQALLMVAVNGGRIAGHLVWVGLAFTRIGNALKTVAPWLRITTGLWKLLVNPITAFVVAGVALQAALYKVGSALRGTNSEWATLLTGLVGVAGIVTVMLVWWDKFVAAIKTAGDGFRWLWHNAIVPAWHGIVAAFQFAWSVIQLIWKGIVAAGQIAWAMMQPVFNLIKFVVMEVLPRAFTFWYNQVKAVVILIAAAIKIWWIAAKGVFNAVKWVIFNIVVPAFKWFAAASMRELRRIAGVIGWFWGIGKAIFSAVVKFLRSILGPAFSWLWRSAIRPIWNAIVSFLRWAWNSGIKPIWNTFVNFIKKTIPSAFRTGVNAVRVAWDKLKSVAKAPVNFVIGLYNGGIVNLMNKIADFAFGKGKGPRLGKINKFAKGGVMPGYSPGRDSMLAAVSPGESIFRPEFTKAVGSRFVSTANRIARTGGPGAVNNWLSEGGFRDTKGFARGGIAGRGASGGFAGHFDLGGIVSGVINGLKDFSIMDPVKAVMNAVKKMVLRALPAGGMFRDVMAGIPPKAFDMLKGWIKKNAGFGGGPGMNRALRWAKTQDNKPYQWAGNGNPSWDCSGFMSAIESVIRGQRPHRRWSTHAFNGGAPAGWQANRRSGFMIGVRHGGAGGGHTAGTLLNHAVEAGGNGVQVGPPARSHRGFPHQFGFKADSGVLRLKPGWNPPVFNGLGTTETLEARNVGAQGLTIEKAEFHFHGPVGSKMQLRKWLVESIDELERTNRMPKPRRGK